MKPLLVLALLAAPYAALACEPPLCSPGTVAPAAGRTVPAGITALPVTPTSPQAATPSEDAHLSQDGAAIAATLVADPGSGMLLVPTKPLTAGDYTITRSESCTGDSGVDAGSTEQSVSFTVGAAVALPATLGTLDVATGTGMVNASTGSGACTVDYKAAVARFSLAPSTELAAWGAVTRYTLTVDGAVWATSRYGASLTPAPSAEYTRAFDQVFARCTPAGFSDDNGLATGMHHATLAAHVAGATTDPAPLAIDFALSCGALPSGDDGIPFEDGGRALGGNPPVEHGCDVGGHGSPAPWLVLPLVALVLGLRRRRA